MALICWNKPKAVTAKDRKMWRGKITHELTTPQVEVHKDSMVIIVGLKGYTYKHYKPVAKGRNSTKGLNIHISSSWPLKMSFKTWGEFNEVVVEAREALEKFKQEQDIKRILAIKSKLGHSFNKKGICVRCGMSSLYANYSKSPCS